MLKNKIAKKYQNLVSEDSLILSSENKPSDLINLSIGDPDINTPKVILDHVFEDALAGYTKYTDTRGYKELRDEIRNFYTKRYEFEIDDKEIFVCASATMGLYLTLSAILDEGDEVLIIEPYFFPYKTQIELVGGVAVPVKTRMENGFQVEFDELESKCTNLTKAIIINTPCNPTGVCLSDEVMSKLAQFAIQHDLVIIADDVYTSFCYQSKFKPMVTYENMKDRVITINSFSKNFLMTGFRIGNIVANESLIQVIKNLNENMVYSAPSLSQRGAIHGLRHFEEFEDDIVQIFKDRVEYAYKRIQEIEFMDCLKPDGTFYLFPSIVKTGLKSMEFTKKCADEAHVQVIPGVAFGESGDDHIRISCTLDIELLKEAFDRIEKLKF